jgi:hypothetical protein
MNTMFQPDYTDCENCGTVDHNDYNCPCGCHGDERPSKHQTAFANFAMIYTEELARAVKDYPSEYRWPFKDVPVVAAKMLDAVKRGSFNKDSRAIRATCKRLGIKHTYTAIRDYLAGTAK